MTEPSLNPPLAYTIPDAVKVSGMSRTRVFALIGSGHLDARKCGRRTLVAAHSLKSYLSGLPSAAKSRKRPAEAG